MIIFKIEHFYGDKTASEYAIGLIIIYIYNGGN